MTEMQAAIGRVALGKLPKWIENRRTNAARFSDAFRAFDGLRLPLPTDEFYHSYYKYYVFIRPDKLAEGWGRDRIMAEINAAGTPCYSGSCSEIYLEKAFDHNGLRPSERLPVAKELGETSLMFLVHPTLDANSVDLMAETASAVFKQAFRVC
jgi:dTDP-4-amino-4,6-dideoxygalactose transaminase